MSLQLLDAAGVCTDADTDATLFGIEVSLDVGTGQAASATFTTSVITTAVGGVGPASARNRCHRGVPGDALDPTLSLHRDLSV